MNDANFVFCVIYVHIKAFIEVRLFICIVLLCSEPQQIFKYLEYLKSLFYNNILKCYSNTIYETRCKSLLPM